MHLSPFMYLCKYGTPLLVSLHTASHWLCLPYNTFSWHRIGQHFFWRYHSIKIQLKEPHGEVQISQNEEAEAVSSYIITKLLFCSKPFLYSVQAILCIITVMYNLSVKQKKLDQMTWIMPRLKSYAYIARMWIQITCRHTCTQQIHVNKSSMHAKSCKIYFQDWR